MRKSLRKYFEEMKSLYKKYCGTELDFVISSNWESDKPSRTVWAGYLRDMRYLLKHNTIKPINVDRENRVWKRYNYICRSNFKFVKKKGDDYDIDMIFLGMEKSIWVVTSDEGICRALIESKKPFLTPYSLLKFYNEFSDNENSSVYWKQFHNKEVEYRSARVRGLNSIRFEEDKHYISFVKESRSSRRRSVRISRKKIITSSNTDDFFAPIEKFPFKPFVSTNCMYYQKIDSNTVEDCLNCKQFGSNCPNLYEDAD